MTDADSTPQPDDTRDDAAEAGETRTRTRTRSRRASASRTARAEQEPAAPDGQQEASQPAEAPSPGEGDAEGETAVVRRKTRARRGRSAGAGEDTSKPDEIGGNAGDTGGRTGDLADDASHAADGANDAADGASGAADGAGADGGGDERPAASRRRRRGSRGRGRRGGRNRRSAEETADASTDDIEEVEEVDTDDEDEQPGSTRLQARAKSGRSSRTTARGRGRATSSTGRGRRPAGGVSEETRRAINEGPPRKMLVTVGEERSQIAVLEERTLVEHYVTRKEDVSYVGNIYLGRVQNVLPGMEAAFVDIGKGRNGVLYAGEVNYDEADLEGELPRIEQTLKSGQTVLVQVTKDPMGTKGARLTQHLSVAGRYCVLAPGDGMMGISRKLTDDERERLRKILKGLKPEGYGLIVRTAAEGATREQLEADIARLVRIWDDINSRVDDAKPLDAVYEEPNLVMRVIRDVFGTEFSHLVADDEGLAGQIRDYLSDVSPDFVDKVSVHTGDDHIFDAYEVTNQIRRALEKKVWLKSGGYLIIEKTEAMWVIDVNTGKFVGERNLEETVLRNNLEAAEEIARQLRLRDMGGIIVIDFVDMLVPANRDEVLKRFKRELARDKTKSRVMEISKLGLVQMTRKNVSQGLQESFTVTCDACEGRGAQIVEDMLH
ncbi:MAG TPA: Rne/Rng family ribonuclease [Egibacteraceae bacterium]|nr:Rne/Rng family ribonuclease [Egibacteraceae bacterium]